MIKAEAPKFTAEQKEILEKGRFRIYTSTGRKYRIGLLRRERSIVGEVAFGGGTYPLSNKFTETPNGLEISNSVFDAYSGKRCDPTIIVPGVHAIRGSVADYKEMSEHYCYQPKEENPYSEMLTWIGELGGQLVRTTTRRGFFRKGKFIDIDLGNPRYYRERGLTRRKADVMLVVPNSVQ